MKKVKKVKYSWQNKNNFAPKFIELDKNNQQNQQFYELQQMPTNQGDGTENLVYKINYQKNKQKNKQNIFQDSKLIRELNYYSLESGSHLNSKDFNFLSSQKEVKRNLKEKNNTPLKQKTENSQQNEKNDLKSPEYLDNKEILVQNKNSQQHKNKVYQAYYAQFQDDSPQTSLPQIDIIKYQQNNIFSAKNKKISRSITENSSQQQNIQIQSSAQDLFGTFNQDQNNFQNFNKNLKTQQKHFDKQIDFKQSIRNNKLNRSKIQKIYQNLKNYKTDDMKYDQTTINYNDNQYIQQQSSLEQKHENLLQNVQQQPRKLIISQHFQNDNQNSCENLLVSKQQLEQVLNRKKQNEKQIPKATYKKQIKIKDLSQLDLNKLLQKHNQQISTQFNKYTNLNQNNDKFKNQNNLQLENLQENNINLNNSIQQLDVSQDTEVNSPISELNTLHSLFNDKKIKKNKDELKSDNYNCKSQKKNYLNIAKNCNKKFIDKNNNDYQFLNDQRLQRNNNFYALFSSVDSIQGRKPNVSQFQQKCDEQIQSTLRNNRIQASNESSLQEQFDQRISEKQTQYRQSSLQQNQQSIIQDSEAYLNKERNQNELQTFTQGINQLNQLQQQTSTIIYLNLNLNLLQLLILMYKELKNEDHQIKHEKQDRKQQLKQSNIIQDKTFNKQTEETADEHGKITNQNDIFKKGLLGLFQKTENKDNIVREKEKKQEQNALKKQEIKKNQRLSKLYQAIDQLNKQERLEKAIRHFYDAFYYQSVRHDIEVNKRTFVNFLYRFVNSMLWVNLLMIMNWFYIILTFFEPDSRFDQFNTNHYSSLLVIIGEGILDGEIPYDQQLNNFETIIPAISILYSLVTIDLYPESMLAALTSSYIYLFYFIPYLLLTMMLLIPIPVSIVFEAFKKNQINIIMEDRLKQRSALFCCFVTLDFDDSSIENGLFHSYDQLDPFRKIKCDKEYLSTLEYWNWGSCEYATLDTFWGNNLLLFQVLTGSGWSYLIYESQIRIGSLFLSYLFYDVFHLLVQLVVVSLFKGIIWEIFSVVETSFDKEDDDILQEDEDALEGEFNEYRYRKRRNTGGNGKLLIDLDQNQQTLDDMSQIVGKNQKNIKSQKYMLQEPMQNIQTESNYTQQQLITNDENKNSPNRDLKIPEFDKIDFGEHTLGNNNSFFSIDYQRSQKTIENVQKNNKIRDSIIKSKRDITRPIDFSKIQLIPQSHHSDINSLSPIQKYQSGFIQSKDNKDEILDNQQIQIFDMGENLFEKQDFYKIFTGPQIKNSNQIEQKIIENSPKYDPQETFLSNSFNQTFHSKSPKKMVNPSLQKKPNNQVLQHTHFVPSKKYFETEENDEIDYSSNLENSPGFGNTENYLEKDSIKQNKGEQGKILLGNEPIQLKAPVISQENMYSSNILRRKQKGEIQEFDEEEHVFQSDDEQCVATYIRAVYDEIGYNEPTSKKISITKKEYSQRFLLNKALLQSTDKKMMKELESSFFAQLYGNVYKNMRETDALPMIKTASKLTSYLNTVLKFSSVPMKAFFQILDGFEKKVTHTLLTNGSFCKFIYQTVNNVTFSLTFKNDKIKFIRIRDGFWKYHDAHYITNEKNIIIGKSILEGFKCNQGDAIDKFVRQLQILSSSVSSESHLIQSKDRFFDVVMTNHIQHDRKSIEAKLFEVDSRVENNKNNDNQASFLQQNQKNQDSSSNSLPTLQNEIIKNSVIKNIQFFILHNKNINRQKTPDLRQNSSKPNYQARKFIQKFDSQKSDFMSLSNQGEYNQADKAKQSSNEMMTFAYVNEFVKDIKKIIISYQQNFVVKASELFFERYKLEISNFLNMNCNKILEEDEDLYDSDQQVEDIKNIVSQNNLELKLKKNSSIKRNKDRLQPIQVSLQSIDQYIENQAEQESNKKTANFGNQAQEQIFNFKTSELGKRYSGGKQEQKNSNSNLNQLGEILEQENEQNK
ncbi:hypothetical protein PPERSA_11405 [Pseudocohnilembus persalinus]|uniref:Transmembrane protein n=1 Tax=Pseudocohnilembus persalinus TaxID=266149 RepID=A0A0V0QPW6_PSEPJ|nr:hypothetical protein PPERSA_11405 [Pseudocohnilembus persalinus]|eukprot:KRX04281.1 hypothetical protein PPERSA_11405 [Pseudocohnilembus persalinus]